MPLQEAPASLEPSDSNSALAPKGKSRGSSRTRSDDYPINRTHSILSAAT
jgi:hypothetical protein